MAARLDLLARFTITSYSLSVSERSDFYDATFLVLLFVGLLLGSSSLQSEEELLSLCSFFLNFERLVAGF